MRSFFINLVKLYLGFTYCLQMDDFTFYILGIFYMCKSEKHMIEKANWNAFRRLGGLVL